MYVNTLPTVSQLQFYSMSNLEHNTIVIAILVVFFCASLKVFKEMSLNRNFKDSSGIHVDKK